MSDDERELVVLNIRTYSPEKYRLVDTDTGEVWQATAEGGWVRT